MSILRFQTHDEVLMKSFSHKGVSTGWSNINISLTLSELSSIWLKNKCIELPYNQMQFYYVMNNVMLIPFSENFNTLC